MRVVGMISGTSMDGIDVAVADLRFVDDTVELRPLGATSRAYPAELRAALGAVLPPAPTTRRRGVPARHPRRPGVRRRGDVRRRRVRRRDGRPGRVARPDDLPLGRRDGRARGTLQVGQPAWIAEATGLPVVADVRARDIAAGGHGAPLASTLDDLLLAGSGEPAGALNLGGISNITVVAAGAPTIAFDIGPANALIDAAVARRHRRRRGVRP